MLKSTSMVFFFVVVKSEHVFVTFNIKIWTDFFLYFVTVYAKLGGICVATINEAKNW